MCNEEKDANNEIPEYYKELRAPSRIGSLEMRQLILDALALDDADKTPRGETFKQYGYKGTIGDLRAIVEHLAVSRGLVAKVVEIKPCAWGATEEAPHYKYSTNFNIEEQNAFLEEVHMLIYQNVISPGEAESCCLQLPFFHVTSYGKECLKSLDILPYDPDDYIAAMQKYNANEWEIFYITEALRCYNAGAYSAAITMLGILGEYIAEQLIEAMGAFLTKNEPGRIAGYKTKINKAGRKIADKYKAYEDVLKEITNQKDTSGNYVYPKINSLKGEFDDAARSGYSQYVRLTRNDLAHPAELKKGRNESLLLFVSFIKYFEVQHDFLKELISLA